MQCPESLFSASQQYQEYPEEINDELIEAIKNEPKVCHYLDMPIQHASDNVLKRMGRKTDKQERVVSCATSISSFAPLCTRCFACSTRYSTG